MYTEYRCTKCRQKFAEEGLPNINKRHRCGEVVSIIKHVNEGLAPDQDVSKEDLWDDWWG